MGKSLVRKLVQWTLIAINICKFICGVVIIIFGVRALYDLNVLIFIFDNIMACVGLTLIGVVLCIFSLAAIYGIYANNKIFLVLHAISVFTITLTCLVLGVAAFIHLDRYSGKEAYMNLVLRTHFEEYKGAGYLISCLHGGMCDHLVDLVQFQWQCCGMENQEYWSDVDMPASCCAPEAPKPCTGEDIYKANCVDKGYEFFRAEVTTIGVLAFLLAILSLLELLAVLYLIYTFVEEYYIDIPRCMLNTVCLN